MAVIGCFAGAFVYKLLIRMITFGSSLSIGSEYNGLITALVLIFLMALISELDRKSGLDNV
jgi:uncharacterized membrane protein YeaQ/YmgE (transglycosylase-associated protein family)